MANSLKAQLDSEGFVIIPSPFPESQLSSLRTACHQARSLAESSQWPHLRTLPKQFPPWSSSPADGIWGIQHLLHPDMPSRDIFAASYFSSAIVNPVKELLSPCSDDDLVMELYNLLVRPSRDFELRWHRDDIPPTASAGEEMQRLAAPAWHAQWNLALYDDDSLIVVPGSHRRPRTEYERHADPYEKQLPGQLRVMLKAGDIVFYDNNLLHRGVYHHHIERMTLHGSIGHVAAGRMRARNVLQHGVGDWIQHRGFGDGQEEWAARAERMRLRLIELETVTETDMSQDGGKAAIGFSQSD